MYYVYGSFKGHKQEVHSCIPFRQILSNLGTLTYNLAKFLVPKLNPLTKNEYIVKESFYFAEQIYEHNLHYIWVI